MDVEEHQNLLQPFVTTTTTTSKSTTYFSDNTAVLYSNSHIASRFILIFFIFIISIFANYQASKGFEIIIINEVKHTSLGDKFHLFFVSNDKATQIVLNTSNLAEQVLYPDNQQPKKPVFRVTVRFTNENLTSQVVVKAAKIEQDIISYEYVLHISSSLMEESNIERSMVLAVQRAMVRVWLWNNRENNAPDELIDGIVEYVMVIAGLVPSPSPDYSNLSQLPVNDHDSSLCWKNWDQVIDMVQFLKYSEMMRNGFIGRLNQAMQGSWHDHMVDDALGLPVGRLCESYYYYYSALQSSLGQMSYNLTRI